MNTIKITNENDYAQIFSNRCGCHCAAKSKNALTNLCQDLIPAVSEKYSSIDELLGAFPSYAPNVHIEICKNAAYTVRELINKRFGAFIDDCIYLDTEEYEEHDSIEACPTEIVDVNFVICDLSKLAEIIESVSKLGTDADVSLNFLFRNMDVVIAYLNGNIIDDSIDPALRWRINNGKIEKPDSRIIIHGDDIDNILYYGCHLFRDITVADWKNMFGVEIEVGFKDEND